MKFPGLKHQAAGVAIPVSALRSSKSFGIGEFSDLPLLGAWCRSSGLDVLQILPVNDTGSQSSPYSALSAFALHPVYIRLEDLPELKTPGKDREALRKDIEKTRIQLEKSARVKFSEVLHAKEAFLRRVFAMAEKTILADGTLRQWIDANPWAAAYCLFRSMKDENNGSSWVSWPDPAYPGNEAVGNLLRGPKAAALLYYAWVQMRLEEQFKKAALELDSLGVYLKGDLPILMSEDSADVWSRPEFFRRDLRAGAPPDMFSETGQNWGFPIYNWNALKKDGYSWWKERLRRADLFYHAYRIDHVLGFFRIWAIPEKERTGVLGHFHPSACIRRKDFEKIGFDEGRIRWMSQAHVPGEEIRGCFGADAEKITASVFKQIPGEDLFLFRPEVGEAAIEDLGLESQKTWDLLHWYRNRGFVAVEKDLFCPAWYRDSSRSFGSLQEHERKELGGLVVSYYSDSEKEWERTGEELLRFMKETTSMLPCAEDLGVVPDCVPRVLERLGILGLRVPRWTRRYKEAGEPYVSFGEYSASTVCAPSVHDTSTLREWWEKEADRDVFWRALGYSGPAPAVYDTAAAEKLFSGILETRSALAIFQFQDYLALEPKYRTDAPAGERVNVPGTVTNENWSYRMPFQLEELAEYQALSKKILTLMKKRKQIPAAGAAASAQ